LHVSNIPEELPGREKEYQEILIHLSSAIKDKVSCCLYIAGVPGTGKTVTVKKVINKLEQSAKLKKLEAFNYLEINGMQLSEPNQIYSKLWQAFTGDKFSDMHALNCLNEYFEDKRKIQNNKLWVIVIDELDLLMNKSQSILYNLFEWPFKKHGKMVLITIANTMDLPERLLENKVASRLGLTRVLFNPYTFQQLQIIIQHRLSQFNVFYDDGGIEICSRKVAAISGDARRVLDICRRAVEILENDIEFQYKNKLSIKLINTVIKEMYQSPIIKVIQTINLYQKLILIAF
ncbi:P-loop containing nucleoside triphosphate hydrolase protein, partial [Neoconidiobolus thromboides FSU 785]